MRLHIRSLHKAAGRGAMVLALTAAPALLSTTVDMGGTAYAAEKEQKKESKYAKKKTKRVQAMSPAVAKKFTKAQEAAEAENWVEMKEVLDKMKERMTRYNKYEQAMLWNLYAYYYYTTENYKQAIHSYQQVVSFDEFLPDQFVARTLFSIAQLYYVQEDYRGAIKALYQWMERSAIVTAKNKVLLAQAHYQLNELDPALRWVEEAISDYEAEGKVPEENWWGIQKVIYYDKKNLHKVTEILEKLAVHYPKAKYWRQLGGMYSELNRDLDRLVAYDSLYIQGMLTKESRLRGLAYMYLGADVPYKAAQIMDWGIKEGHIKENTKNLKLMGEAFYAAQEVKKSIPVMEKAAKLSDDGVLLERLVGMYINNEQFKKAVEAAKEAQRKGGVKRPGQNYLFMGMALSNMKRFNEADKAFKKAAKYEKSKKPAEDWMKYNRSEKQRLDAIKESRAGFAKG